MRYETFADYGEKGKDVGNFVICFSSETPKIGERIENLVNQEWNEKLSEAKEKEKIFLTKNY